MRAHKGGISLGTLLALLILIAGGLYLFMQRINKEAKETYEEREHVTREPVQSPKVSSEDLARQEELAKAKEEDLRRQKQEAAEKLRLQGEKAKWAEAYAAAIDSFEDVNKFLFWPDLKDEKLPDFASVGTTSWCLFDDFAVTKSVYVLKGEGNGAVAITKLQEDAKEESVTKADFEKLLSKNASATLCSGVIYLRGIAKNNALYPLPKVGKEFRPLVAELGDLGAALIDVGADFDERLARLTLCSKDETQTIPLGVVPYGGALDDDKIGDALEKVLAKEKQSKMSVKRVKPKLIKFRQTVFLYDGHIIKKTTQGITYVPRYFQHLGTSRAGYREQETVDRFYLKWSRLYDEALRQERRAREVEQENAERIANAKQQTEERRIRAEQDAKVKSHEVEDEYGDWLIRVERGKKI